MNKEPDRSQRKALGKGLSALLPSRSSHSPAHLPSAMEETRPVESSDGLQSIPLDQIQPGQQQPRDHFDEEKLQELAQSLRAHGLIQPITVRKTGDKQYRIVAGERRWRAAKIADLKEIPAMVRAVEPESLLEMALIENIQREDLNAIEVAAAFHKLHTELRLSHEEIAERTGKNRSTVTNFLRLLKLVPPVRHELATGGISMGHARALLNLDGDHQAMVCSQIVREGLSVRAAEAIVKRLLSTINEKPSAKGPAGDPARDSAEDPDANVRAALDEMAMALGTRVKLIARTRTTGVLQIEYYSQEDLDRIYSVIAG